MRLTNVCTLATIVALAAACSHEPTKPTGPVTVKFTTPIIGSADHPDSITGYMVVDGTDSINIPFDTLANVSRGDHRVRLRLTSEYMERTGTLHVDPIGSVAVINIDPLRSCKVFVTDAAYCVQSNNVKRNILYTPGRLKLLCSANDYGEYCSSTADENLFGAVWPRDSSFNQYASNAKLLIAGIVGPELAGGAGHKIAMGISGYGDYSPLVRLGPVGTDSTRYQNEVWSDARHMPIYTTAGGFQVPLPLDERPDDRFGLGVKITYFQPVEFPNAIFVRYDVTNVSATATYRYSHKDEPVGGHTLQHVYLTPMIDPDIGGNTASENTDDNATVFPADNLVVAYDQAFNVSTFNGADVDYATRPGLLGMQFISTTAAATPIAVIAPPDSLKYYTSFTETNEVFPILAAGRETAAPNCNAYGAASYVCLPESATNVAIGYSVGPIASIAPGETQTLTIAILIAPPKAGTFTSGTAVAPQNSAPNDTTRQIYQIAENLRLLAQQTRFGAVTP